MPLDFIENEPPLIDPTSALKIIQTIPNSTPIVLDFDETLFLRNSTEEYLRSLQPRALGAILLLLLDYLKPWQWLPGSLKGDPSRDWLRVVIATFLFPWTLILWVQKAKTLAQVHCNEDLINAVLKTGNRIIVATYGFGFIVQPILRHMGLPNFELIALSMWQGGRERSLGKLHLVQDRVGKEARNSLVVTDSDDDAPLLKTVAYPCLVKWPQAQYVPALADAYIPFFYMERVKRPGQNFLKFVILGDEFFFLLLAFSWLSPQPIFHGIGLFCLVLSFWCIYEIGYMENDLIAESYEEKPKLSETYAKYKGKINYIEPWLWAILLALPGIALFARDRMLRTEEVIQLNPLFWQISATYLAIWLGLLLSVRFLYSLYNYIDEYSRIWLYMPLQISKFLGFLLLTVSNGVGTMFFTSQVIARWLPYLIYRHGGNRNQFPMHFSQVILFGILLGALRLNFRFSILEILQMSALAAVLLYRSRREFGEVLSKVKFISKIQNSTKLPIKFLLVAMFNPPSKVNH